MPQTRRPPRCRRSDLQPTMNTRTLLLAAALAVACLAVSAQARDLQQVGDEAEALVAQQVAAQVGAGGRQCGWAGRRQTRMPAPVAGLPQGFAAVWCCLECRQKPRMRDSGEGMQLRCTRRCPQPPPPLHPPLALAQEEKIKNYRQQEEEHNQQQEEIAASGGRKGRGKKGGRGSDSDGASDDSGFEASNNYDSGSDGGDDSNPFYGRDPSDLSKAEKRKARRQAKKLGLSLDEYLGWQGGSSHDTDYTDDSEEAPRKKGRKGRRSGPADDSSDSTGG